MKALRVLIVDDEPAARSGLRHLLNNDPEVQVVGECRNGKDAVRVLERDGVDLVFLDIQMPELDGFGVVNAVGAHNMPAVIFVTAYDRHALRAFDVHAVDYLLKPFTDERFQDALAHAKSQIAHGRLGELSLRLVALMGTVPGAERTGGAYLKRLPVKEEGRVMLLPVREIDWIEAEKDYVRIHANKRSYVIRETMKILEHQLDPERFVRIHRSSIVNIERVRELYPLFKGEYGILLHDGTELKLSRGYRDHLEAMLGRAI